MDTLPPPRAQSHTHLHGKQQRGPVTRARQVPLMPIYPQLGPLLGHARAGVWMAYGTLNTMSAVLTPVPDSLNVSAGKSSHVPP